MEAEGWVLGTQPASCPSTEIPFPSFNKSSERCIVVPKKQTRWGRPCHLLRSPPPLTSSHTHTLGSAGSGGWAALLILLCSFFAWGASSRRAGVNRPPLLEALQVLSWPTSRRQTSAGPFAWQFGSNSCLRMLLTSTADQNRQVSWLSWVDEMRGVYKTSAKIGPMKLKCSFVLLLEAFRSQRQFLLVDPKGQQGSERLYFSRLHVTVFFNTTSWIVVIALLDYFYWFRCDRGRDCWSNLGKPRFSWITDLLLSCVLVSV